MRVYRIETAVVKFFERKAREFSSKTSPATILLSGVQPGSGVMADFERCGLRLHLTGVQSSGVITSGIVGFRERSDAVDWCKEQARARALREDMGAANTDSSK